MTEHPGPLTGWRVLLPRPAGRGERPARLLAELGATPLTNPVLEIAPAADPAALSAAVDRLVAGAYDWVAFPSVPAVEAVAGALGPGRTAHPGTRIAAVGPVTAAAVAALGGSVDLVPEAGSAAGLLAAWPTGPSRILLPRSAIALPALGDGLRAAGHQVDRVTAYAVRPLPLAPDLAAELRTGLVDAVLLTSPSAARVVAGHLHPDTVIGAIGETTAAAVTAHGLPVTFTAGTPTDEHLIRALLYWAAHHPRKAVLP